MNRLNQIYSNHIMLLIKLTENIKYTTNKIKLNAVFIEKK